MDVLLATAHPIAKQQIQSATDKRQTTCAASGALKTWLDLGREHAHGAQMQARRNGGNLTAQLQAKLPGRSHLGRASPSCPFPSGRQSHRKVGTSALETWSDRPNEVWRRRENRLTFTWRTTIAQKARAPQQPRISASFAKSFELCVPHACCRCDCCP